MTIPSRRPVRAVLFDLDNTLADRDRAFRAWACWFTQHHCCLVDQQAIDEAVAALISLDADGRTPKDVLFSTVKDRYPHLTEDVNALSAAFREQLLGYLPPLDVGAARLIDALDAAGMPWGIVTNGSASQLRKVETLDLVARATCIVISDEVGARKPAPQRSSMQPLPNSGSSSHPSCSSVIIPRQTSPGQRGPACRRHGCGEDGPG